MGCRQIILIALSAALAAGSLVRAGFTISVTKVDVVVNGTQFDRYDIFASNDGAGTGADVKGMIYQYTGDKAYFGVLDTDGNLVPDTVNLPSSTLSRVRVVASAGANTYVNVSPTNEHAEPNPYLAGVKEFSGGVAKSGGPVPIAPVQIARLFLLDGTVGTFSGAIGGDIGALVPFTTTPITFAPDRPVITPPEVQYLHFGSDYADQISFTATVQVSDPDGADVLSLTADPVLGVHDVRVIGGGVGPQSFTLTGTIDASHVGTVVYLPVRAHDGTGNITADSICLVILPEPSLPCLIVAATAVGLPRSRRREGRFLQGFRDSLTQPQDCPAWPSRYPERSGLAVRPHL